jgi:ribosomal protein S18 acetylase RimI-like enzyme
VTHPPQVPDRTSAAEARHRQRAAAELHVSCIREGFLPTLGHVFLEVVYRCIDEHPDCVLLSESIDGQVVGFVSGTTGRTSLSRVLSLHPFRAAGALAPSLLSIGRLKGIANIAGYSGRRDEQAHSWPSAELLSIAVHPDHRGKGVAERLFRRLEQAFGELGVGDFRVAVGANLAPALSFYRKMGCKEKGRITLHGAASSMILTRRIGDATQ